MSVIYAKHSRHVRTVQISVDNADLMPTQSKSRG
jgi:hypothetical protein